jgi:hypothetical protein
VKGIIDRCPVHKPVNKGGKGKKEAACWMEERALSMSVMTYQM